MGPIFSDLYCGRTAILQIDDNLLLLILILILILQIIEMYVGRDSIVSRTHCHHLPLLIPVLEDQGDEEEQKRQQKQQRRRRRRRNKGNNNKIIKCNTYGYYRKRHVQYPWRGTSNSSRSSIRERRGGCSAEERSGRSDAFLPYGTRSSNTVFSVYCRAVPD